MGFYASGYVSALGKNSSGGSTGSASALYQLADVVPNSTNDGVLNATNGSVLMYNGSKWQAGNVVTDISPLVLNVNGSSLFTYDGKSSITANLTVPTKVSQLTNDTGFITGISSSMVTSALGYTPYNSTNPNGYISGITKAMVEGVLTGNITSHTHPYLPLNGGKLSSDAVTNVLTLNSNVANAGTYLRLEYLGSKVAEFGHGWGLDTYMWCNGHNLRITSNGTVYADSNILIHSGNYNSFAPTLTGTGASGTWGISISGNAATATNADMLDGYHFYDLENRYVNVTGDTMTGSLNFSSSDWIAINFSSPNLGTGTVGGITGSGLFFSHTNTSNTYWYMYFKADDGLRINNKKVWYEDNDGSGSGLDADTLDGYHHDAFCKQVDLGYYSDYTYYVIGLCQITGYTTIGNNASGTISVGRDNGIYNRSLIHYSIQTNYNTDNVFFSYSYLGNGILKPCTFTYNSKKWAGFVFEGETASTNNVFIQNHYSRYSNAFYIQYYNTQNGVLNAEINNSLSINGPDIIVGGGTFFGNSTSTTKLQTARTIWGQSFDGTGNVDGILTLNYSSALRPTGIELVSSNNYESSIGFASNSKRAAIGIWLDALHLWTSSKGSVLSIPNDSYGNVGIGTTSPERKLHINSGSVGSALKLQSTQSYTEIIYQNSGAHYWSAGSMNNNTFYFWNSYKGGVTATRIDIDGNFATIGAVTAKASSSDIRLKTDITDYKALSIIKSHKSIKYHWNAVAKANADIFNDDYWHYGLIAQDVQRDMPQMVSDVFKDYLVINYERLIPICWKGLQEVDDEVTKLKKKVRKLEMEIRELKQKEDRL